MNDSLIREVNEAVRQDKLHRFWREYRTTLIVLVAALILGTAGGQIYRQQKEARQAEFTQRLLAGIEQFKAGAPKKAARSFAVLAKDNEGEQAALANLWRARAALKADETQEAADVLRELAEQPGGSLWHAEACVWLAGIGQELPKSCIAKTNALRSTNLILKAAEALAVADADTARRLLKRAKAGENVTPQELSLIEQLSLLLPMEQ